MFCEMDAIGVQKIVGGLKKVINENRRSGGGEKSKNRA